jgi:intracellular multiplication protein IcmB
VAVSRVASSFLAFSSSDSLLARNALRDLAALGGDAHAIVRLRLGLLTWVGAEDGEQALAARLGRLQQVAEGWGEAVFTPLTGDPLESLAASVPGFCCGATAQPALVPIAEALRLFPVGRPAPLSRLSTETGGAHLFRSPDGKPLPLAAGEGGDYGFELIYGLPGQGKSVLMNALGLAFCLQGGQTRLPLAAVIDIGPSSSGLVSLVREALPPDRRHEAGWFPLRMTSEHAINPCDTQLGCRFPLPAERAFLTNLLGLMVTPAGDAGVPDGMRELLGPTLTGAYAMRSDKVAGAEPHDYTEGRDERVDAAIAEAGLRLPEAPLWWDVVDLLFEAGEIDAAARAQRYAVPTLVDLLASVREPAVQGLVGDARYGSGGETVTQAFIRILTALSGDWPVMFSPTAFDVGGARLAAIDLAEVAPQGSAEADRQSAAFYLLARHALTRHWWIGEDALAAIPEPYRDWHATRLRDIRESPKRLCYDEFHRTGGAPAVRAQVERDVREARKLRVRLALASQRLEDFGGALAELANRYWILGSGGKAKEAEALAATFSLTDTLSDAIRYRLTGPGRDGAPALLIASGQGGRFEQLVVNTPGPVELWALTTSPADVALRRRLYALLPPVQARAALARAFPEGTARSRIERELARMDSPEAGRAASEEAVLDRLADEVVRAAGNQPPYSTDNAT